VERCTRGRHTVLDAQWWVRLLRTIAQVGLAQWWRLPIGNCIAQKACAMSNFAIALIAHRLWQKLPAYRQPSRDCASPPAPQKFGVQRTS
jgi:hypothetical protein